MTRLHFTQCFTKCGLAWLPLVLLIAWLVCLQPKAAHAQATTGVTTTLTADTGNAAESPGVSELRRVKVNFFINSISHVNNEAGTYQLDCYLDFYWLEPVLQGKQLEEIDQTTLWDPLIEPINSQDFKLLGRTYSSSLEPRTNLRLSYRLIGTFNGLFDLRRFPFDQQLFTFQFESQQFDSSQLLFDFVAIDTPTVYGDEPVINPVAKGKYLAPDLHVPGWTIGDVQVVQQIHVLPYDKSSWAQFGVDILATRQSASYLWRFFLELFLLQTLFWSVLFLESHDLFARLLLLFTLLLVTVVFNFITLQNAPHTPILTLLEQYMLLCYATSAVVAIVTVIIKLLHQTDRDKLAGRINAWARLLYPIGVVVLNGLLFWTK